MSRYICCQHQSQGYSSSYISTWLSHDYKLLLLRVRNHCMYRYVNESELCDCGRLQRARHDAIDIHGSRLCCLLCQHVQVSTHSHGHTLDLIVFTADTTSLSDWDVCNMQHLSDHRFIVAMQVKINKDGWRGKKKLQGWNTEECSSVRRG